MKLDLGCGPRVEDGWTGIDLNHGQRRLNFETEPLPYSDNSIEAVRCHSALEHISHLRTPAFLKECHRVLVPGGELEVSVPDARELMLEWLDLDPGRVYPGSQYQNPAQARREYLTWCLWGNQRLNEISGQTHKNGFTENDLRAALLDAGFASVRIELVVNSLHACQMIHGQAVK